MNKLDEINEGKRSIVLFAVAVLALGLTVCPAAAAPIDDLASPDQATRDAAAKILRATYSPPPRAKWEPLLTKITPGMTRQSLTDLLKPYNTRPEMERASGGTSNEVCRLDDAWMLHLVFNLRAAGQSDLNESANTVMRSSLVQNLSNVWIEPPKKYSGTWRTYFVNGQKSNEIHYRDGLCFGEFISYHDNGQKSVVQHYDETGCNGDEVDYFPTGKVESRGRYAHNAQEGVWTFYNEDGSIRTTVSPPK